MGPPPRAPRKRATKAELEARNAAQDARRAAWQRILARTRAGRLALDTAIYGRRRAEEMATTLLKELRGITKKRGRPARKDYPAQDTHAIAKLRNARVDEDLVEEAERIDAAPGEIELDS